MSSVLNIEPQWLKINDNKNNFKYDFLDSLIKYYNIDIEKYYGLLNSMDDFKLKNIYNFLYLRTYKIKKIKGTTDILREPDYKITPENLNMFLKEFITDKKDLLTTNTVNSIIIMNGIQLYFTPQL
tara:strand:- start:187 stop:564 length:378 start_codon:yes stop_codon:yes gene_type:complete